MSKYLFIIESPGKQKKISSFLGKDFVVIATAGHIMDLPAKGLNVDIKKDFKPTYAPMEGKQEIIRKIKDAAKKAEIVYIGTDLDREGSMIANSVASILPEGTVYKRVTYNAITKEEILKSIDEAGDIDLDMVDSAECRRILDRLCGYKTSFATQQATGGKSAGRVQSAGLRILAEREKEIKSFVPQEYWPIEVTLERKNGERVVATIKVPKPLDIPKGEDAENIIKVLKKEKWVVSKYETKEKSVKAYPPFTTSSLYQAASSNLGWDSKKTASVSQELYEEGSITYIRSDSTFITPEFMTALRTSIPTKYGRNYLPSSENVFGNKKGAQEAHEAIRMTHIEAESVSTGDKQRLYEVIWKRTLASQMANMKQFAGSADFSCNKYVFGATGSKIIFDGWKKVWDYGSYSDTELPEFEVGEEVKLIDVKTEQKFTQPPQRYSEASFIKELESRGIGRPSTYKTIIEVLKNREYADVEKKAFHVTDMGIRVSDFLVGANICFVDLDYTQNLETELDQIAKHETGKLCVLTKFWDRLSNDLKNAKDIKQESTKTDYPCKKCEGFLEKKFSKFGPFYSCSNRTDKENPCDYKCQIAEDGSPIEKSAQLEKEYSQFCCPNCGEPFLIRASKKNADYKYLGCRNWKDKKCQGFFSTENGEKLEFKKKTFKKWGKKKKEEENE